MSDSTSQLPARPSLEQLRKQAKELLRAYRNGENAVLERFRVHLPRLTNSIPSDEMILADAQFVLARDYGFENWAKLVHHIAAAQLSEERLDQYEQLAKDLVAAYHGDAAALQRLNELLARMMSEEQLREFIQQRLGVRSGSTSATTDFVLTDAQLFVARQQGFEDWTQLAERFTQPAGDPRSAPHGLSSTPPFYKIDWQENRIELRPPLPPLSKKDWETIFDVMKELRITGLNANGQLTDEAMEGLSRLDHVTDLNLGGTKRVTDEGLKHLARMSQLQDLDLSEYPGGKITDRGLEALRHLTELRRFQMCWQSGLTDAGIANLAFCDQLENVNLLGSPTGDGVIRALAGKPNLRQLKTGQQVTDAGLPLLHQFPMFKTWRGGEIKYGLMSFGAEPTNLLLDGSFTNDGLASIAGLEGLFGLSFFWHLSAMTPEGLKHLSGLPNLGYLGCQDALCNDEAMRHIAVIPTLRMLMGQGAVASDDGFAALSRSQTIEYIWGRDCPHLGGRGFTALSQMPALKGLAVSLKNVGEPSLSALPRFPALRGLMPMDVSDDEFRYVGQCEQLEDLWCMYCRETGDAATEHLAGLSKLKTYYAGKTKITDRSLEILGRLTSLERIEFWECAGITNAGLAHLAGLPRLREFSIGGSPNVTREGMAAFPHTIRINYS